MSQAAHEVHPVERLEVVSVPIDSIHPNPYNPNRQSEHEFEQLCKSIQEEGFNEPVMVQRDTKQIVDGEHRWRACKKLGFTHIDVQWTDFSAAQMRMATLRHNRARGDENPDKVVDMFKELEAMGSIGYATEQLGLDQVEVERLLAMAGSENVDLDISAADLGPDGHGLTAQDVATGVDTAADERRAKDAALTRAKQAEERAMGAGDESVYRLQLVYTGEEAKLVQRVLGHLAPAGEKEPLPHAVLRLCRWSKSQ